MSCEKILKQICDDLAEDINSDVCDRIRMHLDTCPHCKSQLNSMRNTVKLFNCLDEREVPAHIHERLFKLLNVPAGGRSDAV